MIVSLVILVLFRMGAYKFIYVSIIKPLYIFFYNDAFDTKRLVE